MIYFIEDDNSIRDLVLYALKNSGYEAEGYPDGHSFFSAFKPGQAELILLDVMLPGDDGLSVLRKIRANSSSDRIPVIMVTALGSEFDKVTALDAGADDYITKPFGMMELLARIRAVLRRVPEDKAGAPLSAGDLVIYGDRRVATAGGREINLTFKEFELLLCLMENRQGDEPRQAAGHSVGHRLRCRDPHGRRACPQPEAEARRHRRHHRDGARRRV